MNSITTMTTTSSKKVSEAPGLLSSSGAALTAKALTLAASCVGKILSMNCSIWESLLETHA